jgi:hypothetical protein
MYILYLNMSTNIYRWGRRDDATYQASFFSKLGEPGADPELLFARYVSGFFDNTREYLQSKKGGEASKLTSSLSDDPQFQKEAAAATDTTNIVTILHQHIHDIPEEREKITSAAVARMANSGHIQKIGLIYGLLSPPECIEVKET